MDKEKYNTLSKENQELVFDEMLELINLIYNNRISIEHFKVLTKWINYTGKSDTDLRQILLGICPTMELNDSYKDEYKILQFLEYSEETLRIASVWNRILKMQLKELHKTNLYRGGIK